jgi:hypothetical protein
MNSSELNSTYKTGLIVLNKVYNNSINKRAQFFRIHAKLVNDVFFSCIEISFLIAIVINDSRLSCVIEDLSLVLTITSVLRTIFSHEHSHGVK